MSAYTNVIEALQWLWHRPVIGGLSGRPSARRDAHATYSELCVIGKPFEMLLGQATMMYGGGED